MFLSSTARMHQYYSAWLQEDQSCVARWLLTSVAYGRTSNHMPPRPTDPERWLAWNQDRKWPVVSFLELSCPFTSPACPKGWHGELPWFDRLYHSSFRFGATLTVAERAEKGPRSERDMRAIKRSRANESCPE